MDDPVIEFEINPDRAYALSLRGIAREAALGFDVPVRRPGRADDAGPRTTRATRSSSTTPTVARSSWPARSPASTRRRRHPPGWRPRLEQCRHAPDQPGRRHLQLRHARARPAATTATTAPSWPVRSGSAGRRRGRRSPPSTACVRTLDRRRSADRRRQRPDRHRRHHGRRDHRAVRDHDRHRRRGRALRPGHDLPRRQAAQAALRGVQALRARRRPRCCRRPRPTVSSSCSSSWVARPPTRE